MITNTTSITSWISNQRKKIIYIIVLCFIVLAIIIPTTIVLTKKGKSTTTTQTSTISTTTTTTTTTKTTTTATTTTTTKAPLCYIGTNENPRWSQNGITVAGGNGCGDHLNPLFDPIDIYVDDNQTLYIIDEGCRIFEWENGANNGKVIVSRNDLWNPTMHWFDCPRSVIVDKENDSLIFCTEGETVMRWPRRNGTRGEIIISNVLCYGLMMDNDKYLYTSDRGKDEVRRWQVGNTFGKVVAGGNGRGDRLDQLNSPMYIFVDQNQSIYISDRVNRRVMKWVRDAKKGIIVAGGQTEGNSQRQLSSPTGLIIDEFDNIYVGDDYNHRVMRWSKNGTQACIVVGGNGAGSHTNQFNGPRDLSFDQQGNLYVVDYGNCRVQKFNINSKNI